MSTCFVIQPFDKDKFDRRYNDVFEPAIKAANLSPYRVDRDPSVRIAIEQIEEEIKNAAICFADITTNNPNVWYELGYAFAMGKDVVMVCSNERSDSFPFDIQHRQIIKYTTQSRSDFNELENNITTRLNALLKKQTTYQKIISTPVKENHGLKPNEIALIALIMENQIISNDSVSIYNLTNDMSKSGYTKIATSIAVKELELKEYLETFMQTDIFNHEAEFAACRLTKSGINWVLNNQDNFEFKKQQETPNIPPPITPESIDELPF